MFVPGTTLDKPLQFCSGSAVPLAATACASSGGVFQAAKEDGEREMREVTARTEEDTDAEIQALTQRWVFESMSKDA